MNAKSVYIISCIACSLFLYIWIPAFGSLKAYATDNNNWLWVWSVWILPFVVTACIAISTNHMVGAIVDRVKSALK